MTGSKDREQGPRLVKAPPAKTRATVIGPGCCSAWLSSCSLLRARSDSASSKEISLALVLPAIRALLQPQGSEALVLVKPQFEVGPGLVDKKGIVRDGKLRHSVLKSVTLWLDNCTGWKFLNFIESPISGGAGNREFLVMCLKEEKSF